MGQTTEREEGAMLTIELDRARLLGFDQADVGLGAPLQAKVGDKGGGPYSMIYVDTPLSPPELFTVSIDSGS